MKRLCLLFLVLALVLAAGCAPALPALPSAADTASPTAAPQTTEAAPPATDALPQTAPATEPVTEPAVPVPPETAAETEPPAPTDPPLDPEALVEEALFEEGEYEGMSYHFSVPRLTPDTEGARAINEAIEADLGAKVQAVKEGIADEIGPGWTNIGFYTQVWEDVLTLVTISIPDYEFTEYQVYCYDVTQGRRLSTREILDRVGTTEEEFLEACRRQFVQTYQDNYSSLPEDRREEFGYYEGLARVDGPEYVNMDLMTYPDQSGDLVVIAPIYSLAGASYYYQLVYLGLGGVG